MATIALAVVGNYVGGPQGAQIGATIGSYVDMALISSLQDGQRLPDRIGSQLDNLKVQTSAYGQTIPQVFGYMRMGGNVIWSQDIKETERRESHSSGGGKGGIGEQEVTQTSVTYSYSITLAIAVCEGLIEEITGIWADSKKLDATTISSASGKYEVHLGAEDQDVSSIIESYNGVGNTPAYRGLAYVVIEDFPLAEYGNRIPNFTFEVKRPVQFDPSVEDKVKDIAIIPGSGEFVYSTSVTEKFAISTVRNPPIQIGKAEAVNMQNFDNTANVNVAVEQMQKTLPNLEWVAVIVNWFITSKDMSIGEVVPKIEFSAETGATTPDTWEVGSFTRSTAQLVETFPDGSVTYGGTPSDHTVIELCTKLKAAGYNVLLYPMPLVDTVDETAGEDDKPWRGRLVPASTSECNDWFTKTNGYNAFIRHYSQLSGLADQIDAFVIGTELVGITTYDSGSNTYPGVTNLKTLAGLVAGDFSGSGVQITYAADWSEYHSVNGYYHLDPLWADANIDFVGIDNYMPLTPDLPQSQITQELIQQYWEDGEGWEYFYTDSVNRTGKTDYTPNDGTSPFAWKNIEQWWNSAHSNSGTPTGWTAKMKPIWFTEFGFPSVDGATNQPNVFVDPSSVESFYPRGSRERVDFVAQRDAVEATLDFWQAKNAQSGNSDLVPRMFLWTWDARPYPFFPDLLDVWADGRNWKTGHWVNGKFGISALGAIIADLLEQVGLTSADYDVEELDDPVEGYFINQRQTVRSHLELLRSLYFFDVVESDGILKFIKRGNASSATINEEELIPEENNDIRLAVKITRKQELELPRQVDVSFINRPSGYLSTVQTAQRQTVNAVDKVGISAPLVMSDSQGRQRAEQGLYTAWVARTLYEFALPPKYAFIDAGDVITLTVNNVNHVMRVASTQYGRMGIQKIRALAEDISTYDFYIEPGEANPNPIAGDILSPTRLELMDLPRFPSDSGDLGAMRIAMAGQGESWRGVVLYRSDDGGEAGGNTFYSIASTDAESIMGNVLSEIVSGPRNNWDYANQIDVVILSGELQSVTELGLLNGANACVCGNEIIQFQNATLIGGNQYRLSKLLRGRLGTEHEMGNHSAGERFIFLDSAVLKNDFLINGFGLLRYYKPVTVGDTLANTTEATFTYTGNTFKPLSPVHIAGSRDGSGNLTITWVRRTRIDGDWRNGVNVPLGEESESYEVDIMDGSNVVRTILASSETASYTAAQQIADFGSIQSSVTVKVYQMSAVIGRGYAEDVIC